MMTAALWIGGTCIVLGMLYIWFPGRQAFDEPDPVAAEEEQKTEAYVSYLKSAKDDPFPFILCQAYGNQGETRCNRSIGHPGPHIQADATTGREIARWRNEEAATPENVTQLRPRLRIVPKQRGGDAS